jgi:hypothetical protein
MITINSSNKIIFHRDKDYEIIKNKFIFYKHLNKDETIIHFSSL